MPTLQVRDLEAHYGTSHVLFGITLDIEDRTTVCLLGRNGAGKTTTLKSIMGVLKPTRGSVRFNGEELAGRSSVDIARLGLGYVPEERIIFPDLTVRQNLEVGIKPAASQAAASWSIEAIYELFPMLKKLDKRVGAYLSGGEQQMLSIGRTLMGNPSLLLLDEPVEGLAPAVVSALSKQINVLKNMGLTLLFSEQNLAFSEAIADKVYIIETGEVRYHGDFDDLNSNDDLKHKYLSVG
ncbi:ABC transporter ATP-binding protein [Roseibium sp. M-1]